MTRRQTFLWGAVSSLFPEIIRLYRLVTDDKPIPIHNWLEYTLLSLFFMAGAGVFCVGWKPETELKAIWLGVSWPVVIAQMIAAAPKP
jgi:hypothetical protein